MNTKSTPPGFHQITRHDGIFQEQVHDTYKAKDKLPESAISPECGAIFHKGRWQWLDVPDDAHQQQCPACHRIYEHSPAAESATGTLVTLECVFNLAIRFCQFQSIYSEN
ncbi:hypothetical protein [Nitrosomonas supralitoralis]|uniref:hypothetical protein n=1 Tax=Nitrosomonas supralitoralis TaxID=2116706 RepID=UPI0018D571D0|nr:hypothetical protein [Nitrosomonas supralitoralis]